MDPQILEIIQTLNLKPHPEGGYYSETYRTEWVIPQSGLPSHYPGSRHVSTAIYYLLTAGDRSKLHRVKSDEIWHFYGGDPLELIEISPEGSLIPHRLGNDLQNGSRPQVLIPAGSWQGATVMPQGSWTLVGCTVAPAFEFEDFELGQTDPLLALFPQHSDWIRRFT